MTYLGSLCAANSIRITSIVFIAKFKFKGVELTLMDGLVLVASYSWILSDGQFGTVQLHRTVSIWGKVKFKGLKLTLMAVCYY